ncbi:MAG: ribosome-associated translation inhibitor RaiA [Thermodesulfovibrionales bacterium]|nr:ribosome-associated translation inhibitor RaiA [Thermodesulfovibrionales bacterium]
MNIIVTGRNLEITPALRDYAEKKIAKFERYLSNITEAIITLSIQKYQHKAEVLIKANGYMIQAEGVTGEIYSSIDEVVEKLEKQIKKYKEKINSHRKGENKASTAVTGSGSEKEPRIIKIKRFDIKPMSPEEAAMQMELLDKNFFVFENERTGQMNVIYKRNDGNYGLIEPAK